MIHNNSFSLPGKFALLAFLIAGFGILGIAMYSYQDAASLLRQQSVERISGELHRLTISLRENVERMRLDTQRIAASDAIAGYYRAVAGNGYDDEYNMTQELWKKRIELEFVSLLQQRPEYLQVRYIGVANDGLEIVRVERKGEDIIKVGPRNLQSKGQYDYVKKTIQLSPSEQFISAVELNREFGSIVIPIQPVIRAAAPVYTPDNQVFGVIVINVNFNKIVNHFSHSPEDVTYLIADIHGDYLFHPKREKLFTRALGGRPGLIDDYPELDLLQHDTHTIDYKAIDLPEKSASLIIRYLNYDPLDAEKYLIVAALASHKVIDQQAEAFRIRLVIGVIIVVVFLSLAMAMMARFLLRPIRLLTDAADRIAAGDEDSEIPVFASNDELGQLARSFNTMLAHLKQSQQDLRHLADSLEGQVKKRTQELEAALEKAEESARIKSEFLATMSHEIRTPMNGVLGMLSLLENSQLNHEQQHRVELAQSSANALLAVINDILDFSKVEAGKLELEEIDFDLRKMLGDFAEAMALQAQNKGLEIILDLTAVELSMVKGDPGRIRQIFTNIVGNSIKFTDSGEITIVVSLDDIEQDEQALRLCVKITDTGIGIPADKLDTLFDSFSQVDASTTRKYGGTGLGLAIVKQLCQLMGGGVRVSSEQGKGSCFEFDLILHRSDRAQRVMPQGNISQLRLLLVDDNQTNRMVLRGQLEHWGVRVSEAKDGFEALQICRQHELAEEPLFDIALLDMQMPAMDGVQLGKEIKANPDWAKMKLVIMTSMSHRGDARYFSSLGFDGYFPKPATTQDLFYALSLVVNAEVVPEQAQAALTRDDGQQPGQTAADSGEFARDHQDKERAWPQEVRLLLVEDNKINQMVALGMLKNIGLTADVVDNGQQALEVLKQSEKLEDKPYTAILMDCQMPVIDGYEASRLLRAGKAGEQYKNIIIIAMTANTMQGDKEKCIAAGMDDYLSKPIEQQKLKEKLYQWLVKKELV